MADLDDLKEMKEAVEKFRRKRDKAIGALNQTMARLGKAFDCSSIVEAKKALETLKAQEASSKQVFNRRFTTFEKKWGPSLAESTGNQSPDE